MSQNNKKADKTLLNSYVVQNIWDKAIPQVGHNPQKCRRDMFGNLMSRKDLFNDSSEHGWEFTSIIIDPSKKSKTVVVIPLSYKSKKEKLNN